MRKARWTRPALAAAMALLAAVAATEALAAPSGWLAVDGSVRKTGVAVDWANPGPTSTFVSPCPAGTVVSVAGTGGLFDGGRCTAANTPPIAPVLTASAAADPSIISSVFIVDPESGDTTACGAGDPTTTGGQNGDALSSYNISIGPVNNKTDLSNVYAVSHTRADGHPEVYFGSERLVNNGESHVDFEFLQSAFSLAPCATGINVLNGHRTEGDLLIAVDFTNGGTLAGFSVYQWHCVAEPGPQPADGTVCDPAGPEHYEPITTTAVAVTVNAANIDCGGWVCRDSAGVPTATLLANDLMEGGVDLAALQFTGCYNTFLPHTRQSAPITAQLSDFAGPVALKTCRDPVSDSSPGGTVAPGAPVRDTVTLANGGAAVKPTGTIAFFLCTPAQVTATGCTGGTQVGASKVLSGGVATSDPSSSTATLGKYCWRTVYTPDAASLGIYTTASHTNTTTECFTVAGAALPNTGVPPSAVPVTPEALAGGFAFVPALVAGLAWRRGRAVAALVLACVMAGAGPAPPTVAPSSASTAGARDVQVAAPSVAASPAPPRLATVRAHDGAWRLVIPRIGVDAAIEAVGIDRAGAMAAPATLDRVGWFSRGPSPGQPGDAVLDGHYGLPRDPAVFRRLALLRPGDEVDVVWPNGRVTVFHVSGSQVVSADARPDGVFSRSGPARLTLITCSGTWVQSRATYADRLLVTAMLG